jgi:alpha-1,2-glucosyltransferase
MMTTDRAPAPHPPDAARSRAIDRWLGSRLEAYAMLAIITVASLCTLLRLSDNALVADERVHHLQIMTLASGKLEIVKNLTMLPGYHALIALLVRLTGAQSDAALRTLSALVGLPVIATFYLIARQLSPRFAAVATLQFAFLPILFPLFFLLYTDAFSLLLVVLSVLLVLHGRRNAAAGAAIVAVLVRQTNVLCLAFALGLAYLEDHGFTLSRDKLMSSLRHNLIFVLGLAGFAGFVVVNGGVAVGDQAAHPLSLSLGNVYLCLFLYFFLLLPVHLAGLSSALADLADKRVIGLSLILYGVFMFTFVNDHPYNQVSVHPFKFAGVPVVRHGAFLRNELLHLATQSGLTKTLFFVPVLLSCLLLWRTKLMQPRFLLIYPLLLLLLMPSWLIEQRYSLVPLALLLVARERRSPILEYATAGLGFIASVYVLYGIDRSLFFL